MYKGERETKGALHIIAHSFIFKLWRENTHQIWALKFACCEEKGIFGHGEASNDMNETKVPGN